MSSTAGPSTVTTGANGSNDVDMDMDVGMDFMDEAINLESRYVPCTIRHRVSSPP